MDNSKKYVDNQIKWFEKLFEDRLSLEEYRILRLELLSAYRNGHWDSRHESETIYIDPKD